MFHFGALSMLYDEETLDTYLRIPETKAMYVDPMSHTNVWSYGYNCE